MSPRPVSWAAVLLLAAACTTAGDGDPTPSTGAVEGSSTTVGARVDLSSLPGRLVVLDPTGNVLTMAPNGSNPTLITDDAGEGIRYSQPLWSPQSDLLAWAEITNEGFGVGLSDPDGGGRAVVPMGAPPFYMYWSPDGTGIGVLHNSDQGSLEFELVDVVARTSAVVADGSPFYFSWSPESDRVVAHVQQDVFATIDLEGNPTDLGATAAGYQAPGWTAAGIFHLGENGLQIRDPAGDSRLLATVPGPIALVANPQGTKVAVQSFIPDDGAGISAALSDTPLLPPNVVVVVDVATGEVAEVTDDPSIGFFWSPDGEALLVLVPIGGLAEVSPLVWSDGQTRELTAIAPQPSFVSEVLRFFDQYAQSLQLWSPDSSAIALVGTVEDEQGIWVHGVNGGDPVKVADGLWAAWSSA